MMMARNGLFPGFLPDEFSIFQHPPRRDEWNYGLYYGEIQNLGKSRPSYEDGQAIFFTIE
jgi:hypothetical protein